MPNLISEVIIETGYWTEFNSVFLLACLACFIFFILVQLLMWVQSFLATFHEYSKKLVSVTVLVLD